MSAVALFCGKWPYSFCVINSLRIVRELIEPNGWSVFPQKQCALWYCMQFLHTRLYFRSYSKELTKCKGMFGTPLSFILAVCT